MAGRTPTARPIEAPALGGGLPSLAGGHKPYLSIAELSQLTPWTDQAIRTMMSKGTLRRGEHFFYVGRRPIFKWAAIVAFIERSEAAEPDPVPHYRDQLNHGAKT